MRSRIPGSNAAAMQVMLTIRRAGRLLVLAVFLAMAPGCSERDAQVTPAAIPASTASDGLPWYERSRLLDVTGDGVADTLSLRAVGTRTDSLAIALTFVSKGREVFRQEWGSSYELVDPPFPDSSPPAVVESFLRARLDTVLARIRVHPFDASSLEKPWTDTEPECMNDIRSCIAWELRDRTVRVDWDSVHRDSIGVALERLNRAPYDTAEVLAIAEDMRRNTHTEVVLSFGYETTMVVGWSDRAQRFFTLSACC